MKTIHTINPDLFYSCSAGCILQGSAWIEGGYSLSDLVQVESKVA